MYTTNGIGVDSFVKVDAECHFSYDIYAEHVQLRFGGERSSGLSLVFTKPGLQKLVAMGHEALDNLDRP